jgi:hypothetical protein
MLLATSLLLIPAFAHVGMTLEDLDLGTFIPPTETADRGPCPARILSLHSEHIGQSWILAAKRA